MHHLACPDCGLHQHLPTHPERRTTCPRCFAVLLRPTRGTADSLALVVTAGILFIVANALPLMSISVAGRGQTVRLDSGVVGLADHGFLPLALFVLVIASLAPMIRLAVLGTAMGSALLSRPKPATAIALRWAVHLQDWAMLDVFLIGALIALSKLHDLADVEVGASMWALGALVIVMAWLELTLDMPALWATATPPQPADDAAPVGQETEQCHVCHLLQPSATSCRRCHAPLHRRKPDALHRTAALVVTGLILYLPANLYPVFTVVSFGRETTTTIIGGVVELMTGADWPLAIIVLVASVVVPMLKLIGLAVLVVSTQLKWRKHLVIRTRLYRLIELVGRWSAVDIFVAAILTALVTLGNLATTLPGLGVLAFGAVVFVTMIATSTFDPRLMWDAAGANDEL